MGYFYEEERRVREAIEKLILYSGQINDVYRLYEEVFEEDDPDGSLQLAEEISVFFESVKEKYNYDLLELDLETLIYKIDGHYRDDLFNVMRVIEAISADDFEKLCALFLKEILKCKSVNATQRSHDQGIDFVGCKEYVQWLTTEEWNGNLLYVVGQAKHYNGQCVGTNEIRELAGAVYLLKANDFAKKKSHGSEKVIYSNLVINAFTPIVPYFITSGYFSKYAYILCKNASIIAVDRLSLALNFIFSQKFRGMGQEDIRKEIQKIERIS